MITLVICLTVIGSACSQSAPPPPETPEPPTTKSTKGISYSLTFDTDDASDNSSVYIKRNDNVYKFNAKFDERKTNAIKDLLLSKLNKRELTIDGDTYLWKRMNDGEEVFRCKLTDGRLKIFVDKEYVSQKFNDMIDAFGVVLKDAISGEDSEKENMERAKRDLEKAERDLERAKRDLEKAKRKLKKAS